LTVREAEVSPGERRQLTVLFCDLVGSTELSQTMDPEDLQELLSAYHKVCGEAVAAHEGHIALYLGDGVVMYFGYPKAHEDEAQRALRCGLDILEGVRRMPENRPQLPALEVRLGAHTGRVVLGPVGEGGMRVLTAVGDTPNLAARVQAEAPVGGLAVTSTTWGVVQGYFEGEPLGERSLRGITEPVGLWQVKAASGSRDRVEVVSRLTPFIGRDAERQALLDAWEEARRGQSLFAVVSGEPGIGKSRLSQWFGEEARRQGAQILNMRATPYSSTNAFFPVIELLHDRFGIQPSTSDEEKLDRLEKALEARGWPGPEAVGLLGPLLSVPTAGRYAPIELSPARQRAQTMELIADLAVRLAETGPTVLLMEDLHWADPSTLELLEHVVELAPSVPLLGVCTTRPEVVIKWTEADNVRLVELPRLERFDAEAIVRKVASDKPLPSEVLRQILLRAEGVPLFAEEVTRFVLDSGLVEERSAGWVTVGELAGDAIPTSVDASLTARIDRLGTSRATAQLAATIGREFTWPLLREVSELNGATLRHDIEQLVQFDLVRHDDIASLTFSFKHALVRDAAYNSLLRSVRQSYHKRIAAALLERFPEEAAQRPDLIAEHLAKAGQGEAAVPYYESAARQALGRASLHEAADHFRRAIAELQKGPQTDDVTQHQLDLSVQLIPLLMAVYGWAAKEVEQACERALSLARQLGREDLSLIFMWGLWSVLFLRGEMVAATAAIESVVEGARASGVQMFTEASYAAASFTSLWRGDFDRAQEEAEAGFAALDLSQEKMLAAIFSLSTALGLYSSRAVTRWMGGEPREAEVNWQRMVEIARDLEHPPSLAAGLGYVLHQAGYRYSYTQQLHLVSDIVDELSTLSKEEDYFLWDAVASMYRGLIMAERGDSNLAMTAIAEGFELLEQTGCRLTMVTMNVLWAEALHRMGHDDLALEKLAAAETDMKVRAEGLFAPEIWRVRGSVLAGRGDQVEAEAAFKEASRRARLQGARMLELRAALDLFELKEQQGRAEEARAQVAEVLSGISQDVDQVELARAAAIVGSPSPGP
jgi:class 3 adenylate cyclase/tetratricopeptide (TPR) repeat protein